MILCISTFTFLPAERKPFRKIVAWGGEGWGGGVVNVPRTSYMLYCHAVEIPRIVYYTLHVATLLMGWGGVWWVGGHVNGHCTLYMIYCHAAEITGIVYYITCCYAADEVGWGGVGWGVGSMITFRVLRT